MKNRIKQSVFTIIAMFCLLTVSCTKDKANSSATLQSLYNIYKNGEINECKYNSQTVYCAGKNAYDAGSFIYDIDGIKIAECNYGWEEPDAICNQLQNCTIIYRCENNIWGKPFVDKYGLSK